MRPRLFQSHSARNGKTTLDRDSTVPSIRTASRVARRWLPLWLATATLAAASFHWDAVAPEELAARDSTAAPGEDSEILFSRHTLSGDETENYVRAKIYTKKGVEKSSVLSIPYGSGAAISHVMARVLKPDGTAVELQKSDFHETIVARLHGMEIRKTTFAFPNLAPGDIVEYRWLQYVPRALWSYSRFFCQAEGVFTREFIFEVKHSDFDYQMTWQNCPDAVNDPKKHKLVIRNLAPFVKEPLMPPEAEFRGSLTIVYTLPWLRTLGVRGQWSDVGPLFFNSFKRESAPNRAVIIKATELAANAATPRASVARIYRFVQKEIANLDQDTSANLAEARKKRALSTEPQSPAITLELRTGTGGDISLLFAALVRATGLEVKLGMSGDCEDVLTVNRPLGWFMAKRRMVVVNFGESLGYYTPGDPFVPCEMLGTKDEGAVVYVCDKNGGAWQMAPVASAQETETHRTGHFSLDDEGTLDGEVDIELTGHRAIEAREANRRKSADETTKALREGLAQRFPTAEPTEVKWTNLEDNTLPAVLRYHLRVPGYAQSAGSRLVFPLDFFAANAAAPFSSETRHFPIMLGFPEETKDDIELVLPGGFGLDGASAPPRIGDAAAPINVNYIVTYLAKTNTLHYRREFVIGATGSPIFGAEGYHALRQYFDYIRQADGHQLVVRRAKSASFPPAAPESNASGTSSSLP